MIYKCKFVICGDSAVGKTVLITQYVESRFIKEDVPTIGADFYLKKVKEDLKIYILEIGGAKHSLFSIEYYFNQSVAAMVIFDITNQQSFTNIDFWINKIKELGGNIPFVIIGNKLDKSNERRVKFEDANEKAKKHNVRYIETSAKTGNNIDKAFEHLIVQVSDLGMMKKTNKKLLDMPDNELKSNFHAKVGSVITVYHFNDEIGDFEELMIDLDVQLKDLLDDDFILLFVDPLHFRVWLWHGYNTTTRVKFIAAKMAPAIRDKYGIAFKITAVDQDNEPQGFLSMIGLAEEINYDQAQTGPVYEGSTEDLYLVKMNKEEQPRLSDEDIDRDDRDRLPYPYIFTHPRPPDDFEPAAQVQVRTPLKEKILEDDVYCQYCGMKLTKEEQLTHSCKNKPKNK